MEYVKGKSQCDNHHKIFSSYFSCLYITTTILRLHRHRIFYKDTNGFTVTKNITMCVLPLRADMVGLMVHPALKHYRTWRLQTLSALHDVC